MSSRTKAHQRYISPRTGKPVPGVTTIIDNLGWNKGALMGWARKTALAGLDPNKVRDEAGSIGTLAHLLIEQHLVGTPVVEADFPPADLEKAKKAFGAYMDWENSHDVKVVGSELQLAHPFLSYGGTIDLMCELDGTLTLVDFKTSSGIYNDHYIQLCAYHELYIANQLEMEGEVPPYDMPALILHVDKKNGRFTPHYFLADDLKDGWKVFLLCLDAHSLKKRMPFR